MNNIRYSHFAIWLAMICSLIIVWPWPAAEAQSGNMRFIRDTEIETAIADYAGPLFEAAGLNPQSVRIYLVNDERLNAFVAGGMNLFLHTGLIVRAESPGQLAGVLAHEIGHITGSHLARADQDLNRDEGWEQIVTMLLGLGLSLLSGQGEIAPAVSLGANSFSLINRLSYTRMQEQAADQAGLSYLDGAGLSARGLYRFLQILAAEDAIRAGNASPYLRSHPLTKDRLETVYRHLQISPLAERAENSAWIASHKRIQAKLVGFMHPMERVLARYPETDQSIPARYARTIAYYRKGQLAKALEGIDALLAEAPQDPYFFELKGQMLYENGQALAAIPVYQQALNLLPSASLIRQALAEAQIASERPDFLPSAIAHLEEVVRLEPKASRAWYQLAIAYGRTGQMAMVRFALAETALIRNNLSDAVRQARQAMDGLPVGSPTWLRAQDIENEAKRRIQKEKG